MDKPEDKPSSQGPLRPPHPPPGGKKIGGLPKGPVPPRGGPALPGMAPMGGNRPPAAPLNKPMSPGSPLPPPGAPRPPAGPAVPPGMRPPQMPPAPPAAAVPPVPPAPPFQGPVPPALTNKLTEADSLKTDMEGRIADLEKKLLEEREKVLLASLRTKEEEAVSAKVETSIKEIQDKLRREKREQELDDARRKAEGRALDMERRMAEEREAWVSTLKGQLSQRDQVTQEMETHFSTRLKDLEYRWAQEKTALENAVREREAEVSRVRHEFQLKGEQEKSFWEDRVKSISAERDKLDRELDRVKDKLQQEKDQAQAERLTLRDQSAKAENSLKFAEDHHRAEKAVQTRESEAALSMARHQAAVDKELADKQIHALQLQMQNQKQEFLDLRERFDSTLEKLKIAEAKLTTMIPQYEDYKRRATEVEGVTGNMRKQYELEIDELRNRLAHGQASASEEVQRIQNEADARLKTLQARLDWYDSNIKREYDTAREKVRGETDELLAKLKEAERATADVKHADEQKMRALLEARKAAEDAEKERFAIQQELEQFKADWKQSQWDMESQVKDLNDQLKSTTSKLESAEDARIALEQELKQRSANSQYTQDQMEQQQATLQRLNEKHETLKKELEFEKEKSRSLEAQTDDYKKLLQGKGWKGVDDLKSELNEKSAALERAKDALKKLASQEADAEKQSALFREKEQVLRQLISDKEQTLAEFKIRIGAVERKFESVQTEYQEFRENSKKDGEKIALQIEQAKRAAAEEMEAKIRAELPPPSMGSGINESELRQEIENDYMDRVREKETAFETKIAELKEESKKELEKIKWESESMKEELKRAREARAHIEREAQELLQQADDHYQRELEQLRSEQAKPTKKTGGFFTAIGRVLDTPLIDTRKKKDAAADIPEQPQ